MIRPGYFAALIVAACASGAWAQPHAATPAASTAGADDRAAVAQAAADKAAITQIEQRWLAAAHGSDRRALANILAPDFLDINVNGQLRDRADHIAHAAVPLGTTETITQLNVRLFGDMAIATGINHVHSNAKGWSVDVAFTDVFSRIDGHWRAVSSQETLRKPAQPTH